MTQRRRGHHEGTIYQRADGRWVAAISLPDGKRRSLYGKTRQAVRERMVPDCCHFCCQHP
jgi:hypothetical protein